MDEDIKKLTELYDKGWRISFSKNGAYVYAGDINCPYQKEYDLKDGHGFSEIEVTFDEFDDLSELIDFIYPKCNEKVK